MASSRRVAIGSFDISGLLSTLQRGLRFCGVEVYSWVNWWPTFFTGGDYTFRAQAVQDQNAKLDAFLRLVNTCDIFVYIWCRSGFLFNIEEEFALLKSKGKTIVVWCVGGDVRPYGQYVEWMKSFGSVFSDDFSPPDSYEEDAKAIRCYQVVEKYADLIVSTIDQSFHGTRDFYQGMVPCEPLEDQWLYSIDPSPVRCLHVPSSDLKGTGLFVSSIMDLAAQHVPISLTVGRGISHDVLMREMRGYHVMLDELFFPRHGMQAVEAMMRGCIVVAGDNTTISPSYAGEERPIFTVATHNIVERLRDLFTTDPSQLLAMRARSRAFAERNHDFRLVSAALMDLLESGKESRFFYRVSLDS